MRFIHLSDLHIGKQLHHYSLLEEQKEVLKQVIAYVKKEVTDVIVIAGDIYDTAVPSAEAIMVFNDFLTELDNLEEKLTICVIAGNHDSARRLDYARDILAKHDIHIVGMPPINAEEGIYKVYKKDSYGEVVFYLLPFVKPAYLKKIFSEETLGFSEAVQRLLEREHLDEKKRNILVSHQFYAGSGVTPETSDSELHMVGGIDNVEISVLEPFDYAALGHIHRSQKIGAEKNQYCGTIFPYSVSEADEEKYVTLVDLQEKGKEPVITKLPLKLSHKVRKLKGTMEEILLLAQEGICDDYVSITLTDDVETAHPREVLEERYRHILEIRIDNARTRKLLEFGEMEMEKLVPYEAFSSFFEELNGRKMTEEEDELLKDVLQEGGGME